MIKKGNNHFKMFFLILINSFIYSYLILNWNFGAMDKQVLLKPIIFFVLLVKPKVKIKFHGFGTDMNNYMLRWICSLQVIPMQILIVQVIQCKAIHYYY